MSRDAFEKIKRGLDDAISFARGSKPVTGITIKNGKLVRKSTYRAKSKKLAADREEKAWTKKKPPPK